MCVACLKMGIRTKYIGETSRSGYERIKEHMAGLKRCLEDPDTSMEDANPLLKHQGTYHQNQLPEYWARILTKHYTAFSRQIREGVVISKMTEDTDLIMNSKREVTGNRIPRKKVNINGENKERKLLADLEEGGEEYQDRDLWEKLLSGGKRKAEISTEIENQQDQQVNIEATEIKPRKKQRLMTEYLVDQKEEEVDPGSTQEVKVQPQVLNDEVRVLRDQIMDEKMSK